MNKISAIISAKLLDSIISTGTKNIRVLDGSWHKPETGRNASAEYLEAHIPGALFFDIDKCSDTTNPVSRMLPKQSDFGDYVGSLGINNNAHVIVYDNNENYGMFSAARVWWMFRVFGHNMVSVLDGGLPQWQENGLTVTSDETRVLSEKFTCSFRDGLLKKLNDIHSNLQDTKFQLVDARRSQNFQGLSKPKLGIKPGHIPGSVNLPYPDLMDPHTKMLKSPEELQQLFQSIQVDLNRPVVASCKTGVTACSIALAAFLCGKEDVAVYDGSWMEWFLNNAKGTT